METANAFMNVVLLMQQHWFAVYCTAGTLLIIYAHNRLCRQYPYMQERQCTPAEAEGQEVYGREYDEDIYD